MIIIWLSYYNWENLHTTQNTQNTNYAQQTIDQYNNKWSCWAKLSDVLQTYISKVDNMARKFQEKWFTISKRNKLVVTI